jgi:hypothetical protein
MKYNITEEQLKQIVIEELEAYLLEEGIMDFGKKIGKKAKGAAAGLAMMGALAGAPADAMAKEPTKSSSVQKSDRYDVSDAAKGYLSDWLERTDPNSTDIDLMLKYKKYQQEVAFYGDTGKFSPAAPDQIKNLIKMMQDMSERNPESFKNYLETGKNVNIR